MKLKKLIITTDPTAPHWKTMPAKLRAMKANLNGMEGSDWTVNLVYMPLVPKVENGYISHAWFDLISQPLLASGWDLVQIHMSKQQHTDWGIRSKLRGAYQIDADEVGESYFWADEHSLRNGLNQFVQTGGHEDSHFIFRGSPSLKEDPTHGYHAGNPNIAGIFKTYNLADFQPKRSSLKKDISLLQRVVMIYSWKADRSFVKRLQPLVKRQAQYVLDMMKLMGYEMRITSGYRSFEEQDALYAQSRTTPGLKVTNAKGGESFHNYGVALDFVFRKEGYAVPNRTWELFGEIGKLYGFEWGGSEKWIKAGFEDRPHLQMTLGYNLGNFQKGEVDYSLFI